MGVAGGLSLGAIILNDDISVLTLASTIGCSECDAVGGSSAAARAVGLTGEDLDKRRIPSLVNIVVRFVQLDDSNCAIDGTIDGLSAGLHAITVCEYGDISNGCESTW